MRKFGMISRVDRKNVVYNALIILFLGMLAFVILMSSPLNPIYKGVSGVDSSVFKYVATVMSHGGMPYRDTFDHKGPLIYILNWVGSCFSSYRGVWGIEFLFLFSYLIVTYKIARLFCGRFVSLFLTLICIAPLNDYFQGGNLIEEYAMLFIAGGLYIFIDYFINEKISKFRLFLSGFCFGAVCMLRINMAVIWAVFVIAVLIQCVRDRRREWSMFLIWFMLGMAIIVVPLLVWLGVNGCLPDFFNDYIVFNMKYSRAEKYANISSVYNSFIEFFQNGVLILSAALVIYFIATMKKDRYFHWAYLIGIFLSLAMIAFTGRTYTHYGMTLLPLLIYPFARIFGSRKEKFFSAKLVLSLFMLLLIFDPLESFTGTAVQKIQDRLDGKPSLSEGQQTVVDLIVENTTADDQIIVLGNRDYFYLLTDRMASSKYSYQTTISHYDEEMFAEFLNDMQTNAPSAVVMARNRENFFPNPENYEEVYSYEDDDGAITLYLKRSEEQVLSDR